jgi:hypothetical protein
MPVLHKDKHDALYRALNFRTEELLESFKRRDLKSNTEGASKRSRWVNPANMCATVGDSLRLSMAIEDFKTILAEIKKLK